MKRKTAKQPAGLKLATLEKVVRRMERELAVAQARIKDLQDEVHKLTWGNYW